ncbi:MAG: hypothetical protein NkDv07_0138 [Candidatus Improbicoccus devescovinae]|nr:MAG: hypothetical protein NkDv07_0138 [Candidatus Improbicoccus devescovinae]
MKTRTSGLSAAQKITSSFLSTILLCAMTSPVSQAKMKLKAPNLSPGKDASSKLKDSKDSKIIEPENTDSETDDLYPSVADDAAPVNFDEVAVIKKEKSEKACAVWYKKQWFIAGAGSLLVGLGLGGLGFFGIQRVVASRYTAQLVGARVVIVKDDGSVVGVSSAITDGKTIFTVAKPETKLDKKAIKKLISKLDKYKDLVEDKIEVKSEDKIEVKLA